MKTTLIKPKTQITMKTTDKAAKPMAVQKWWQAKTQKETAQQLIDTTAYLKESQGYRQRQLALNARLYGNMSLFNFVGSNASKMTQGAELPLDRPTFNIVQATCDTLVSKITQSRPSPRFLTDNGQYKQRNLAKRLTNFVSGLFYQTNAYAKGTLVFRDSLVEGTGAIKVFATSDRKVGCERVFPGELFVDQMEGIYGEPRRLYQIKMIDREVLAEMFPKRKGDVADAEQAFLDNSAESSKTVSDLVIVVEAWSLPSSPGANDGKHVIACSGGMLLEEAYNKEKFPFIFLNYTPRLLGFWAQGLAEQLMGTQIEINSILFTISKSMKLVGVPRVFVEMGSKVVKAQLNNDIGSIVTYSGTKPEYTVAPCVPQELYAQLQRLIDYGFMQSGVSALQASAQKPAGLNSGEAIRSYDDISTDRFAATARRYDDFYVELAYGMIDVAKDIADEDGKYGTIYPGKNGITKIDLPKADLAQDNFVIQCFNQSSLPRDPAGRLAKVTEMAQAGLITMREARRLLDYPDLDQIELLANAAEERIFKMLDDIVDEGEYLPPDPFTDLVLGEQFATQYINLYGQTDLPEDRMEMLRTWFQQIQALKQAAMPPAPMPGAAPMAPGAPPSAEGPAAQGVPSAPPVSPLIPNAPAA